MSKILITGGAGFIGSNLTLDLLKYGYQVTILDNLSPQIHGEDPVNTSYLYNLVRSSDAEIVVGSVLDKEIIRYLLSTHDILVHLASETGTGQSMYDIEKYSSINIGGTALILDALTNVKHNIKKIILSSSRAVYGEGKYISGNGDVIYPHQRAEKDLCQNRFDFYDSDGINILKPCSTDETARLNPNSIYGITKLVQEQMLEIVAKAKQINYVILRYQNVYGEGQSLHNPYTGILSIFSTLIKNNQKINVFEDGKESRDFVYIDDVVKATRVSIQLNEANNEIFNVGTGVATSVEQIAQLLLKEFNSNSSYYVSGNYRIGDIRHNFADITKITNKLGFVPEFQLEKGIKIFVEWVKSQKVNSSKLLDSIDEMKNKGLLK